jgi:hypothetical protein
MFDRCFCCLRGELYHLRTLTMRLPSGTQACAAYTELNSVNLIQYGPRLSARRFLRDEPRFRTETDEEIARNRERSAGSNATEYSAGCERSGRRKMHTEHRYLVLLRQSHPERSCLHFGRSRDTSEVTDEVNLRASLHISGRFTPRALLHVVQCASALLGTTCLGF